jgi:hypothetical protein
VTGHLARLKVTWVRLFWSDLLGRGSGVLLVAAHGLRWSRRGCMFEGLPVLMFLVSSRNMRRGSPRVEASRHGWGLLGE